MFAKRFEREAKVVAKLDHANIVPIHDYGIDDGVPWMAMRMLPVGSLADLLKRGRLDWPRVVSILTQVAEALDHAHAHAHGIIHRDVKPSNVLLDDKDRVYVGDFGLAHMAEASVVLTQTGMIAGTPQYMSPEQALGETVDHRADIYALGIVAYELFTGAVPFSADTPVAVLMKHANEPLPIPPQHQVPEPLMRPVLKALAKDPADRWDSAGAVATALGGGIDELTNNPTIPVAGRAPAQAKMPGAAEATQPPKIKRRRRLEGDVFSTSLLGFKWALAVGGVAVVVTALAAVFGDALRLRPGVDRPGSERVDPATPPSAEAGAPIVVPGGAAEAENPQPADTVTPPSDGVLLITVDAPSTVALDGEPLGRFDVDEARHFDVSPGQHLIVATSLDGESRSEAVAEAQSGAQQVVQLALAARIAARGIVKLAKRGRDDLGTAQFPSLFSRHTSPPSKPGTTAF